MSQRQTGQINFKLNALAIRLFTLPSHEWKLYYQINTTLIIEMEERWNLASYQNHSGKT